MNYSHAFHAGNFADLVKHAALLSVLTRLQARGKPLSVIDTHGGRGLYDLSAPEARRSAEAERGVAHLMDGAEPSGPIRALRQAVRDLNPGAGVRFYPGSPRLVADRLGPRDRLSVFELNPGEAAVLSSVLGRRPTVDVRQSDGFSGAPALAAMEADLLVLIDPPFERGDDYARSALTLRQVLSRQPGATVLIWVPLKDLETFDAFLRDLDGAGSVLVAEVRLRPLTDPLRMNGCALVVASPPEGSEADIQEICAWIVQSLGDRGEARIWRTSC